MSRKADLEQRIRESYKIISAHEDIIRTSDRPEEKIRSDRQISEQWGLVKGYWGEYRHLAEANVPPDIQEITARFSDDVQTRTWPIGLDVPLLSFHRTIDPTPGITNSGIQFTDRCPTNKDDPPLLYLSVYFKTSPLFGDYLPLIGEKWLYFEAHMRPACSLRIQVRAYNARDVDELAWFLSGKDRYLPHFVRSAKETWSEQLVRDRQRGWSLRGPRPEDRTYESGDYLLVWQENGENRLIMSAFTPTNAAISIHARFSEGVARAFAEYLEEVGFVGDDVAPQS